jgi:hypothetical protein
MIFRTSPLPLSYNDVITKNFSAIYAKEKFGGNPLCIQFLEIILPTFFGGNPLVDGILGHSLLLSRAFSVGIPSWMGFEATTCCCLRPFLVGIPSWMGFEATTCCCLRPFLVGIPSWVGFSRPQLVVVSGLFIHDGIPAITRPFSRTFFLFPQWNSGYHEAFLTNFLSSSTMEFWLSQSLFHELSFFFHIGILAITKPFSRTFFLFPQWNSSYHEAFLTNFLSFSTMEFWLSRSLSHELSFFFHNGILAITKPFSRTFFLFSQWNSGYHEAFLTNFLSFFTMEF